MAEPGSGVVQAAAFSVSIEKEILVDFSKF